MIKCPSYTVLDSITATDGRSKQRHVLGTCLQSVTQQRSLREQGLISSSHLETLKFYGTAFGFGGGFPGEGSGGESPGVPLMRAAASAGAAMLAALQQSRDGALTDVMR